MSNLGDRLVRLMEKKKGGKKVNPWAVCHASTGPEKSDKFERCVMDVKKKQGMKVESIANDIADKIEEMERKTHKPLKNKPGIDPAAQRHLTASIKKPGSAKANKRLSLALNIQDKKKMGESSVNEALKGKQAKLDVNKNGKLDSDDFKMLRAKKKKVAESKFAQRTVELLAERIEANKAKVKELKKEDPTKFKPAKSQIATGGLNLKDTGVKTAVKGIRQGRADRAKIEAQKKPLKDV